MRKRITPIALFVFFAAFIVLIVASKSYYDRIEAQQVSQAKAAQVKKTSKASTSTPSSKKSSEDIHYKPIIDISGWQLPSQIDYDRMADSISGAIVRVHSGAQAKENNAASHLNGIDKSYKTHIEEFQKRDIPVAVYAYVAASSKKEMEKEAEEFYKASEKYHPTYYWLDVEEKTMSDMNAGIEAFRAKLESLGAKNIGIYIGTYFMEEHSINTDKFNAIWIPTYGADTGYYNAAPSTEMDYDLHQYTSQGWISGFEYSVDLNQLAPIKDQKKTYQKLFGS